jgi:hypothetical protein
LVTCATPLFRDGTARISELIWVEREAKYFCKRGWTGHFGKHEVICPSGRFIDPKGFFFVIPGRAQREPGIHNRQCVWIPRLRQEAMPVDHIPEF